jgi:hypothetical protein
VIILSVGSEISCIVLFIYLASRHPLDRILRWLYLACVLCVAGLFLDGVVFAVSAVLLKGIACAITGAFYQLGCESFPLRLRTLTSGICVGIYAFMSFLAPYAIIFEDSQGLYLVELALVIISYRNIDRLGILPPEQWPHE